MITRVIGTTEVLTITDGDAATIDINATDLKPLRVRVATTLDIHLKISDTSTAADATDMILPAGSVETFTTKKDDKVSVVRADTSSTGKVSITVVAG